MSETRRPLTWEGASRINHIFVISQQEQVVLTQELTGSRNAGPGLFIWRFYLANTASLQPSHCR
jgi:hypothetical protein